MIREKDITAVILCMNEENTLPLLISRMKKAGYRMLVPIARRSTDSTGQICKRMGVEHFIDSDKGYGNALTESLQRVTTPFVVFLDGDGSHDVGDIAALAKRLDETGADLVVGSRLTGGSEELYDGTLNGFFRSFFTLCINQVINTRFGTRITDTPNGFRIGRSKQLKSLNLRSDRFEVEFEMIMKALKKGMKIDEYPSKEYRRRFGSSGLSLVRDGWRCFWAMVFNLA